MKNLIRNASSLSLLALAVVLASCKAGGDNPGTEYAPNMYHSVAYEPYTQITDPDAGRWLTSIEYEDGHAEFYNSNTNNPHRMNMRVPAPNTVSRTKSGLLPYRLAKDSLEIAAKRISPFEGINDASILNDGKALYTIYCNHCHGSKGEADGKVATGVTIDGVERSAYAGVANLKGDAYKNITEGHIVHVIIKGKGLMAPHGSQIHEEEAWKIARYVKTLQQ
jgi:mono/diheme cytochrome c family protein